MWNLLEKGDRTMPHYWGVDSATKVTKDSYNCVLRSFGKPSFWGRYLASRSGKVDVLTKDEVQLLHNSGTRVLPIYSNFNRATGYRDGTVVAQNTIYLARRLGFPNGKVLFGNVEKHFEIDEEWVRGFVDGLYTSGFKPGLYHDPVHGKFSAAYCAAVQNDSKVAKQLILWSAEPEPGPTKVRNAPNFRPKKPPCKGNVWGWQYGRDSEICPIDTNLFNQQLYDLLW